MFGIASLVSYVGEFYRFFETTRLLGGPFYDLGGSYVDEERTVFLDWLNQQGEVWKIPPMRAHEIFSPTREHIAEGDWRPPLYRWALDIAPGLALTQNNPKYTIELPAGGKIRKRGPRLLESPEVPRRGR